MGTFGALMGSLIAGLAYNFSGRNYAVTFSLSAVPALGALLLVTTVRSTPNIVVNTQHLNWQTQKQKEEHPALLGLGSLFSHHVWQSVMCSFRHSC